MRPGSPAHWLSPEEARAAGRELRTKVAHGEQASFTLSAGRPSVERFLQSRNANRLPELLPLAHGRMAASAFGFFRGSAGLMAHDLAGAPVTGVDAQLCGDSHVANFGLYGTSDGRIVMDINDFDETVVGPWEWDLKRLAASLVLAGRAGVQLSDKASLRAARHTARSYRQTMEHLAGLPFLDSWTALSDESTIAEARADALSDDFAAAAKKARVNTSERVADQSAHRKDDDWHFRPEPPILTSVDDSTRARVIDALTEYAGTVHESRRHLLARYEARDVAMRVVGTGSVGLRAYVVLMQGNGGEALILQVKQAQPSGLAPYLAGGPAQHEGARIVHGARLVQAETDILLGWTTVDATPFVVRQFRNRKGTIDVTLLSKDHLDDYGRLAGALLARAHSRSIDPRLLAGYCEDGTDLDEAIAAYSVAYADQAESDHAELLSLIDAGRIPALQEAAD